MLVRSPGVFDVKAKPLNVLGKAAVVKGCLGAGDIQGRVDAIQIEIKLRRIGGVENRIVGVAEQSFGRPGELAAEDGLVNEVDSKPGGMVTGGAAHVIAELIFFLGADYRERSNRSHELIVAVGLKSGNGLRGRGEGERECVTEVGVAGLGEMQSAGTEYEASQPGRAERVGIADDQIHVVVMLLQAGRGQRALLYQGVVGDVIVNCSAKKPLRLLRLRPVEARSRQIVAEWDGNVGWHRD